MNESITPIFSEYLYQKTLDINIKSNSFIHKTKLTNDYKYILDKPELAKLKDLLTSEVNYFTKKYLHYGNQFLITTSWLVKIKKDETDTYHYHNHKNSFISGILYLNEDDFGGTQFCNFNQKGFYITANEWNCFNSETHQIEYEKNKLILFPSYLPHQIMSSKSKKTRLSIAFNVLPTGEVGEGDSTLTLGKYEF